LDFYRLIFKQKCFNKSRGLKQFDDVSDGLIRFMM